MLELRAGRMCGRRIAERLGRPYATVARWLQRAGLGRLKPVAPAGPVRRYERAHPGELVHVDVKKLGRFARVGHRIHGDPRTRVRGVGWEYVHVAIDDASRVTYAEVLRDERGATSSAFLRRVVAFFARLGVRIERVMTDNGAPYRSRRHAHPALPTLHQRQGRARDPDAAPGVGLRAAVSQLGSTRQGPEALARVLQS